jgi:2',3'-cyclic-nucleotide 2'-phosphodiesterase (5'-nucleotidase family)
MGYDAVLPGEADFAGGLSLLRDHEKRGIPFTCINLVHSRSGKPVFPPYRKISRGGAKFIVVGVIGQDLFPKGALAGFGWKILPPQEALARFLETRNAEDARILVLTHLGEKEDLSFAKGAKIPLLIFAAHTRTPLLSPVSESGSLIFRPGDRGTNLVEVLIERGGDSGNEGLIDYADARLLDRYKEQRRKLAEEIKRMEVRRQKIYEKALESYDKTIREAEGKLKVLFRSIPLDRSVADDPKITAMFDEYKKSAEHIARTSEKSAATKSEYRGNDSCSPCHAGNVAAWRQDAHSKAFETLKKQGDQANPDCIGCHVTGYGAGGFLLASTSRSKAFEGVGCESCHGPGKGHPGKRMTIPREKTCAPCHGGLEVFPFEKKRHQLGCVRLRSR